jgi:hypothetical protein
MQEVLARITELERSFRRRRRNRTPAEDPACIEQAAFFTLAFAPHTLDQLLHVRAKLNSLESDADAMLAALVLGSLHGDVASGTYLSNQMPRTISTKPGYSVRFWTDRKLEPPDRDLFAVLRNRLAFRYASTRPRRRGRVFLGDMRDLPRLVRPRVAALVITSPPYLDTTSFEEDQWLRRWFLGGPASPSKSVLSPDDRIRTRDDYWLFIGDMWRTIGHLAGEQGHVVIRIAGKKLTSGELRDGLVGTSCLAHRPIRLVASRVSPIVRRQTDSFRPGSSGRAEELDCHFQFVD